MGKGSKKGHGKASKEQEAADAAEAAAAEEAMKRRLSALLDGLLTEVAGLRGENKDLTAKLDDLNDTMQANIEDRDRVIAAKSQVIEDLEAQKSGIETELGDLHASHDTSMVAVEEHEKKSELDAKKSCDEILSQLELLQKYQSQKVEVTEKLDKAHSNFDEAALKRDTDLAALEECIKKNELYWVSEMTKSADSCAKAQREMIDKVSCIFTTMQREHAHMKTQMTIQAAELGELLAKNAAHAKVHVAKQLEYSSLTEMNELSRRKLRQLGALSGMGFVNFDNSTILTGSMDDGFSAASPPAASARRSNDSLPRPAGVRPGKVDSPRAARGKKAAASHKPGPILMAVDSSDFPPEPVPDMKELHFMLEAHQAVRQTNLRATMEVINRSRDLMGGQGSALKAFMHLKAGALSEHEEEEDDESTLELARALIDEEDPDGGEEEKPKRRHSNVEFAAHEDVSALEHLLHDAVDADVPPPGSGASSRCMTAGGTLDGASMVRHDVEMSSRASLSVDGPAPAPILPAIAVHEAAAAAR